jgi:hypothetical protein
MNFETRFRRRLLLAGGAAAALLPWLEALPGGRVYTAKAQEQSPIKRFIVFFWPGGVVRDQYWPTGSERDFTLPHILQPLTAYRDKLLILDGIEMRNMLDGVGHPHTRGMGGLLTGKALAPGKYVFFCGGGGADFPQGTSIDHMIGNKIGADRRFKTLELGVLWPTYGTGPTPQNTISYSGPGRPAQPTSDPWAAFSRIFAGVGGGANMNQDAALRIRKTQLVIDSAAAEFRAVSSGLGAEDKLRLDEHLSRLAEIKASLVAPTGQGAACTPPTGITAADGIMYATGGDGSHQTIAKNASGRMPTIGKQMIDMAVMSLACDLTRVASIQFTDAASRASFPWLNLNENHHFYQHDGGFHQQPCADISRFFVEQFAYLLQRLSEVKEGDKPLIDSTTILMCSEIGDPPSHDHRRVPFVIAGGGGAAFRLGRYLKLGAQPHHKLLVSLLNSYGIADTTIGDAKYGTGPLAGLI